MSGSVSSTGTVTHALQVASAALAKAGGVALGVAMSGAEHPNPDEVLTDVFHTCNDAAGIVNAALAGMDVVKGDDTPSDAVEPPLAETVKDLVASLAAAISLLERSPKKAAPSDTMFDIMLDDYRKSLERARVAMTPLESSASLNESPTP